MSTPSKDMHEVVCSAMLIGVFDYAIHHNIDFTKISNKADRLMVDYYRITLGDPKVTKDIKTSVDDIKRKR